MLSSFHIAQNFYKAVDGGFQMKYCLTIVAGLISITLLLSAISTAQPTVSQTPNKEKAVNSAAAEKISQDFTEALKIIRENYAGQIPPSDVLVRDSIISMLHTLDPHSNFLDAKATEEFNSSIKAQYFGIGFFMAPLPSGGENGYTTYVRATFENSPANRAGLLYGDKILEVNGVSMQGKSIDEVRANVLGPRGTLVKMIVERAGKRETFEIVRDAISLPSIPIAYLIRPKIGYIAMTDRFSETTFEEFQKAIVDLKSQGMESLVLDLRNNVGGLAKQARLVASAFLPRGRLIYTERGRGGKIQKYVSENDAPEKMPLVVLINNISASAAEIVSGALQDNDRALFVGETTFGKGLIQNLFKTEKNTLLFLTTARYETPSGRVIQRDYSGSLSEYYENAGNTKGGNQTKKSAEFKTISGRVIYGGGGIEPDVVLKPEAPNDKRRQLQNRLDDYIRAFSLNLTAGKIAGFESYKIERPIVFNYALKPTDFQVADALYQAFRSFAAEKYKISASQIDAEQEYVKRGIRVELVTAAYGDRTPLRIFNERDNQLEKAIELLPQAKQMAEKSLTAAKP